MKMISNFAASSALKPGAGVRRKIQHSLNLVIKFLHYFLESAFCTVFIFKTSLNAVCGRTAFTLPGFNRGCRSRRTIRTICCPSILPYVLRRLSDPHITLASQYSRTSRKLYSRKRCHGLGHYWTSHILIFLLPSRSYTISP